MPQTNERAFETYVEEILLTSSDLMAGPIFPLLLTNPMVNHGKPDPVDLAFR